MKQQNIIKTMLILLTVTLFLTACSSLHSSKKGSVSGQAGGSAQSYGIGGQQGFGGRDNYGFINGQPTTQVYYFPYDNSVVNTKYFNNLAAQANYLKSHPSARVRLEGNTDERGSREYNIALGERRAKAVRNVLQIKGVNPNQITVISYGEEKPVAFGHNEASYRLNRRVKLIFTAY